MQGTHIYEMQISTQYGGISTVHRTIGLNKKTGETARTMSRTSQEYAHTAMDYALNAQEVNARILQRTSQAWVDGFRYQASLSQGMAQGFFGHRDNALASTTHVQRPAQEQSAPEPAGPTAKDAEVAAKEAQQKAEKQRAERQRAEKQKAEKQKAEKQKAERQRAEKVARETRKAEEVAEETQEATETVTKSVQKSAETAAEETKKSTQVAARDAAKTTESAGPTAKDVQKDTKTGAFPIDGYDEMNVGEVTSRLDGLSVDELKRVGKYEKDHKDRGTLHKEMKQRIKTTS